MSSRRESIGEGMVVKNSEFLSGHDFRAWRTRLYWGAVLKGHDFSRAAKAIKSTRALAPEGSCSYRPNLLPRVLLLTALSAVIPFSARAQYPGQVSKKPKDAPELRAVAVLEWTGDLGKPKASRMVPITIYDGEKLQDAGVYMARPQPLAISGEVEYELKENGKTVGFFDIENAGQEQGSWVGYGKWKPLPAPKTPSAPQRIDAEEDTYSDKPVLHRKHPTGDAPGAKGGDSTASSSQPAAPDDPDRPKLHKKTEDSGTSTTASNGPASTDDPDRPQLHKQPDSSTSSKSPDGGQPAPQNVRPDLAQDIGNVSSVDSDDPNRPTLKRGKSSGVSGDLPPTLMGLPPDMQQAVAVSDPRNRPDHPWTYSWANPDDEKKMKAAMEDLARQALGFASPPAGAASGKEGGRHGAQVPRRRPRLRPSPPRSKTSSSACLSLPMDPAPPWSSRRIPRAR